MRATPVLGSATRHIRSVIQARSERPRTLAAFPTARYLLLADGQVIAVLTTEAVPLPLGIVCAGSVPDLADPDLRCTLQGGVLQLDGRPVVIAGERDCRLPVLVSTPPRVARSLPSAAAGWQVIGAPLDGWDTAPHWALDPASLAERARQPEALVACLLGLGPGLTPAGDDLLAGLLAGARLFGRRDAGLIAGVRAALQRRPRATTSLSGQLLLRAAAGEGIPALSALGQAVLAGWQTGGAAGWGASDAELAALHSAAQAVRAFGGTSGHCLLLGLLAALDLPPAGDRT